MRIKEVLFLAILLLSGQGCSASSSGISGTVIDAETGTPIEGAVVLVEWTKTKGFGLTHTESYKVVEVLTDKDGQFKVPGVKTIFVDPHLTIYKRGYVAWNNEIIFPDYRKRIDFEWGKEYEFKLERLKDNYGFIEHQSFINDAVHPEQASEKKKIFIQAYDAWERIKVIDERHKRNSSK